MVEIKSEIIPALEQIEQLHKVSRDELIKLIENAVKNAAAKFFGSDCKIESEIDITNVEVKTYLIKKVVEKVNNEKNEILLSEAIKIKPDCKIGDEIRILVDSDAFLRIAAQVAKKVLTQKLRESYKKNIYQEYESKIGEITTASVYAIQGKNIILDLGKVEGILPQREQVFKEKLRIGQNIKVLIKDVEKRKKGVIVIASRFDTNFVKKLFEAEIPEIKDGTIEIVKIARAAGYRTKIVLKSNNPKVDPVGSCVGVRGVRIKPIIDELQGERIDLIPYTEDVEKFITFSLSPWKPVRTELVDQEKKIAKVYLPQNIYDTVVTSKNNININLAEEITGWNIKVELAKESNTSAVKEKKDEEK
ncbi:MAG: transcription termination factor NusA [Endomicrobia bacterium]|nr:transcription termination factor NusA [Endomicrobiia bacterium]